MEPSNQTSNISSAPTSSTKVETKAEIRQPLCPRNGNDRVYTPPELAKQIVQHFKPSGKILEPCKGKGAFTDAMYVFADNGYISCYEIDIGLDFLSSTPPHHDWIITNPPWSQLRAFLSKSMQVADNVVFLCLVNAFFMKARQRDMQEAGFGMKEILFVPTPPKPWPQTGFSLGAVHIQRGWTGDCKMTNI